MFTLSKKLKLVEFRKRAGFKAQRYLAAELESRFGRSVSEATVQAWEAGRHQPNLTPKETGLLCEVLNISLDELIKAFEDIQDE